MGLSTNGGVAPGFRLAEARRDFARVFNFVGLRRKYGVDHVDLTWIEGRLRREAETPRLADIGLQSLLVVEVRKNAIDAEHVRCGGRVHDLRSCKQQLGSLLLPPRSQPQVERIILRAEHQTDDAGTGIRDRYGIHQPPRALHGGEDADRAGFETPLLFEDLDQRGSLMDIRRLRHLCQADALETWRDDSFQVGLEPGRR